MIRKFWNWVRGVKRRPASIDQMRDIERLLRKIYAQMSQQERNSELGCNVKKQLFTVQGLTTKMHDIKLVTGSARRVKLRAEFVVDARQCPSDEFVKGRLQLGLANELIAVAGELIEYELPEVERRDGKIHNRAELDVYVKTND